MTQIIPSVNLNDFISGNPKRKNDFVQTIGKAYQEIGFIALKGNFLEEPLINQLYQESKNFSDLPLKTKTKYEIEGIGGQRGYTGFSKEWAKGKTERDLKEFWHFGQMISEDSKYKDTYPENVMVEELAEFNKIGQKLYEKLEKTGFYVLRALSLFIGLEGFYFDKYIQEGNSILRPIHYPPMHKNPKKQ